MEENQFQRLLELFPVVRSSTYCAEDEVISTTNSDDAATSGRPAKTLTNADAKEEMQFEKGSSTAESKTVEKQPQLSVSSVSPKQGFWDPLKTAMQARLGDEEGQRFCEVFRKVHEQLVMRTLSLDDIERMATNMKFRK
ncbi:hypothetical protein R1flu_020213 [Riccia fluitans]|uniref:Uncharacterized protein n=1 Tax=Riccia fluitans TaxID=41844 RepID=A0ABD1ZMB8_9MARC